MTHTRRSRPSRGRPAPVVALRDLPGVRLTSMPDIRGWEVELDNGQQVGRVERLMLDVGEKEVRYLDVVLDPETVTGTPGPRWNVLIPVARARLDAERDAVRLPDLSRDQIAALPDTPPLGVTRSAERLVLRCFGAQGVRGPGAFYANEAFRLGPLMAERRVSPAFTD